MTMEPWTGQQEIGGYPVSGPGVPEPKYGVLKQWSIVVNSVSKGTWRIYFFRMANGVIMMYNPQNRSWKTWRPRKSIVLPRGRTTLSQALTAQRYLDKMWKQVAKKTKALKLA